MNRFFKFLNGEQGSSRDLTPEIVEIDKKMSLINTEKQELEKKPIKLRQKKLGGGIVSPEELQAAERILLDRELDLKALQAAREELWRLLLLALEKERGKLRIDLSKQEEIWQAERKALKEKLLEAILESQSLLNLIEDNPGGDGLFYSSAWILSEVSDRNPIFNKLRERTKTLFSKSSLPIVEELKHRLQDSDDRSLEEEAQQLLTSFGGVKDDSSTGQE
ncbi:MAG: hypothetical protein NTW64_01790 [Candidatus Omnitrophica bacterium]|nr:hypothetical protein [Candidatus Omnitrophota bacterium]